MAEGLGTTQYGNAMSGTTANQPSRGPVGESYFDTTEGVQKVWNGTSYQNAGYLSGELLIRSQPAPQTATVTATLTAAQLLDGILTGTHTAGATQTYTLPTGTLLDAALPSTFAVNDSFDLSIINLSAAVLDTITIAAGATLTVVGTMIVESAHADAEHPGSAMFRFRKTAANTFVCYRIS